MKFPNAIEEGKLDAIAAASDGGNWFLSSGQPCVPDFKQWRQAKVGMTRAIAKGPKGFAERHKTTLSNTSQVASFAAMCAHLRKRVYAATECVVKQLFISLQDDCSFKDDLCSSVVSFFFLLLCFLLPFFSRMERLVRLL